MTVKKAKKKASTKQAQLFGQKTEEHVEPANIETNLSPIVDKKTYDKFVKTISLRIYTEFEKTLRDAGVARPELTLVGFDLKKSATDIDIKMSNYVALNARLIQEKAFVDSYDFANTYMPRVVREMQEVGSSDMAGHMESKIQHDIMMEIRTIAIVHIPESERYSYISKLKVL
jgi:hypothetical protein